ncbi:hypothetical protein ISS37_09985 [candidate division KSB1 bacterium]|nr:hypothetical protein [candidate division KSB1 bacterium]
MIRYSLTTNLPFSLRLKNDEYRIRVDGKEYSIVTYNYWTQNAEGSINIDYYEDDPNRKPTSLGLLTPSFSGDHSDFLQNFIGRNVEYIRDDTDHFRKTILEIFWSSNEILFLDDKDEQEKKEKRLYKRIKRVINEFIEKYRICSGEYYKPTLRDLPFRSVLRLANIDEKKFRLNMNLDMRKAKYALPLKAHNDFRLILADDKYLNSTRLSMNSARYWYELGQYRNCLIDVITAIEPVIINSVKNAWETRGVSKTKINELSSKVDLHYLMSVEVIQLLDEENSTHKMVYDNMLESITLRNKAVHQNLIDIGEGQANKALSSAESLIEILK